MRNARALSRGSSRTKSPSPSSIAPNLNTTMTVSLKKGTRLPLIAGPTTDDINDTSLCSLSGSPPTLPPSSSGNSGLIVGTNSQQGKRPYQEDEFHIRQYLAPIGGNVSDEKPESHFFGLFDGHAGGRCSKYISTCLANTLAEDHQFVTNLPMALKRSFHTANDQFLKIAEKMKMHDGSTGIVAIVRDTKVLVANVGDCRCLIISGGKPIQMSIDQKPTDPAEQKRIAALGGQVVYCMGVARVNRVLAVSRAFGNRTLRTVIRPDAEMMQRDLTKDDDYLVMASDGLWDVLKNKDVNDICYAPYLKGDPRAISEELVNTALARGSMDNVTCVCVKLSDYVQRFLGSGKDATRPPTSQYQTYPGLGNTAKVERTNSYNNPMSESFFMNPNGSVSGGGGAGGGGAGGAGGGGSNNNTSGSGYALPKQFSLGSIKPSDFTSYGIGGGSGNGGYDPNASTDNVTIVGGYPPTSSSSALNGSGYPMKRAATPQRVAPLHRTPSGNGTDMMMSSSMGSLNINSPHSTLKKMPSTVDASQLALENTEEKFNFGPPPMYGSASPQTTRQYMTGSPVLYNTQPLNDGLSNGHSLKVMRGTQASQSFGANENSEKSANGISLIHDDLSQFASKNRPASVNAGLMRNSINSSLSSSGHYNVNGIGGGNAGIAISFPDNVKQQAQQQQQLMLQQQQLAASNTGYAMRKIPSNPSWDSTNGGSEGYSNGKRNTTSV